MTAPSLRPTPRARGASAILRVWREAAVAGVLLAVLAVPAAAQDDLDQGIAPVSSQRELDEGVAMEVPFEPGIEENVWEVSAQFGYYGLDQVLWGNAATIVDIEDPEHLLFANTELMGEQSFSPQLRFSRTFGTHFSLDFSFGTAFGDFRQSIDESTQEHWADPTEDDPLTEEESEKGSFFAFIQDVGLTWYPRGEGRMQPYLTAGIGSQWYDVDSDYFTNMGKGLTYTYGGGLRVVMDDLYSFRLEVRNYHTEIEFDVNPQWRLDQNIQGTALIGIPVLQLTDTYDENGVIKFTDEELAQIYGRLGLSVPGPDSLPVRLPVLIKRYEPKSYSSIFISAGFVASF